VKKTLPIYSQFITFTTIVFVLVVIVKIILGSLPSTNSNPFEEPLGYFALNEFAVRYIREVMPSLQWFVQFGVVIFMFQGTTSGRAVKLTIWISIGLTLFLLGVSIVPAVFKAQAYEFSSLSSFCSLLC
jgi:hypothetical protein